jgi:uncharacterized coiled-coil protein SlyX
MTAPIDSPEAVARMLANLRGGHFARLTSKLGLFKPDHSPAEAADMMEALAARLAYYEAYAKETVEALNSQISDSAARVAEVEAKLRAMSVNLDAFEKANHRQAICLHLTAQALGPDYSATVDALPKAAKDVAARAALEETKE